MKRDDFLIELLTEELPPKALLKLATSFRDNVKERLEKAGLPFSSIECYATPRRLAVFVKELVASQEDQVVERKGPALQAAFDEGGEPTQACIGFARSCGVSPRELQTIRSPQGSWVGYKQTVAGKSVAELMPTMIADSLQALPIPKRMRWGAGDAQFVRPVHSLLMLYGDQIIEANLFGCQSSRVTSGHRFHAPGTITIPHAAAYVSLMETEGSVIVDFNKRRQMIRESADAALKNKIGKKGKVWMRDEALLDEVTGLVEWPVALCGQFDEAFLKLPAEVLISSMQEHQRYFPVVDDHQKLLPYFVTISNINTLEPERVIHGNERVLRARLADAAFFYTNDQEERLEKRLDRLTGIVFQAKLGTLYEKAERLSLLSGFIARKIGANAEHAARAGLLAKTDLTTNMVNEFPELQGVMGSYYAKQDGESEDVVFAMREHYLPRFSGDRLPARGVSQAVALADRLDTLIGTFGINQIPTGDKDPYGLRRATVGVLRILIENKLNLDLKELLEFALNGYNVKLDNPNVMSDLLSFMQERLRAWYLEQGIAADVFASVAALQLSNPLDIHARIQAVTSFKKLNEAEALSVANKRVSNILSKYDGKMIAKNIDQAMFENHAERELSKQLDAKSHLIARLSQQGDYEKVLLQLAELREPIDQFFDEVMVMTDDVARRENRILLLGKLRELFLYVADIALLQ